jgi:hypothetical protein
MPLSFPAGQQILNRVSLDLVQITRQPEAKVLDIEFGNEDPLVPSHARHERRSPPSA